MSASLFSLSKMWHLKQKWLKKKLKYQPKGKSFYQIFNQALKRHNYKDKAVSLW